jgi:cytochrome c biogenesis protein CcmG/thiol:disulfide interchange protein DsbE
VKPIRIFAFTAAAAFLMTTACSRSEDLPRLRSSAAHANFKPAPDFQLKDDSGNSVKLADYRGKVVLLNFWATWCGPCKIEIPWFMEFQQQYKDKGFEVLGVAMDDDGWTAVKPYIAEHKMNYRVVLGTDAVATAYGGIESLPTTFVIDQDGHITASHIGLVNKDEYVKEIQQLLETRTRNGAVRPLFDAALLSMGATR